MITKNNFKDVLKELGFTAEGNIFQKSIGEVELKVDFDQEKIIYPEDKGLKVNERQTCNFSQDENFVVFECVHQLLEKGYKPEHLELEPRWRVGHGASGGRADILVKDQEDKALLIIECKTPGAEFERAWQKTQQDGDQLFSYAQQIQQTQYLCLYASSFINNKIRFDHKIIAHCDKENILEQDTTLLSFTKANDVEERFAAWRDTYGLESTEVGIFEHNIQAYQIGKNNYTLADDTKTIDATDKEGKYHDFRTILRKHNIARRENAFEVLVNLFLCKLVDEEDNENDLQFYWKGMTYDNYFDFVDRLQDLYQKGMGKFLNEAISYISNEQIDDAFWTVKNKRNATKRQIQRYFRELKFFTNSAFSFLDTHNEELFNKNTKVLSEIVQMWQGLRLKTDDQNQFLGEMFELFLDDGIKQSEGQFFTPLPICKFILASLPLAQKIVTTPEPIKAIDYACGSGHFLNEYAHQIKPLVAEQKRDLNDYYSQIIGIEKEDRLAKVAKVAAYMHGQEQIKILDADALASHPEIPRSSFDVLVANPPFAVEGFLQTLSDADKKQYQLIQATGESSDTNTIQCFFLERIHHLMSPGGIVGVIVPSSILSNTDAVHTGTREILLQFFDLVSIAELGKGAFGKTGTNTVVLFLRRKTQKPEIAEHYLNRVADFFEGDNESAEYQDDYLIKAYCNHIEVPYEEYIKLFAPTSIAQIAELLQYDIFDDYKQAFSQSREMKNLKKSNVFRGKTATEQSAELEQRFIAYLHAIEKNKLHYFILAHEQENKVLIVNAPSKKKEQDQFLGYWWSEAKGREGIKYEGGETVNDIITPLFNPNDLDNDTKINTAIKRNFIGETANPLPACCNYVKLIDMLDFSRTDFNKAISLNPKLQIEEKVQAVVNSGYQMKTIDKVLTLEYGISLPKKKRVSGDFPVYGSNGVVGSHNEFLVNAPCIIVGRKGSAGEVNWSDKNCTPIDTTFYIKLLDENATDLKFTYHMLKSLNLPSLKVGSGPGGINRNNVYGLQIPVPPLEMQQKITDECETVDQETEQAHQIITAAKQKIEEKVQAVVNAGYEIKKLENLMTIIRGASPRPIKKYLTNERTGINWIKIGDVEVGNKYITKTQEKITKEGAEKSRYVNPNDFVLSNSMSFGRPYILKISGCVHDGWLILQNIDKRVDKDFLYLALSSKNVQSEFKNKAGGGPVENLNIDRVKSVKILVPPLDIQQQLVAEVEQLDAKIPQAQAVIDTATERKNAILTNYL